MSEKMNAELLDINGKTLVIARPTGFHLSSPNVVITVEGAFQTSIAKGIVRMLNEDQCPACGKFNGLHGEIFNQTSNGDGSGEVRGHYTMCPNAKEGR